MPPFPPDLQVPAALGLYGTGGLDAVRAALGKHPADGRGDAGPTASPPAVSPASFWRSLAEALRERGHRDAAIEAAGEAVAASPQAEEPASRCTLALALIGGRRTDGALAEVRRALLLAPDCAPALRILALTALGQGVAGAAEQACRRALRTLPGYAEAVATLGLVRMVQGRATEADTLFRVAEAAEPGFPEALGNHATLLASLGHDGDAARKAARATALKPALAGPHALLATLRRKAGRLEEAAAAAACAIEADPDHLDARATLADTLRLLGREEEAAAVCLTGLERQPGHLALLVNLGAALQAQGDSDGALAAYGQALSRSGDLPEVLNNVAMLHRQAGRPDEAAGFLRRARAIRPGDPVVTANLVATLLDAGRTAEAGAVAAEAVQAAPSPDTLGQLGMVLCRLGRPDEAEAAFRETVRSAPANPAPLLQAGGQLLRAGWRERALPYLRAAIRLAPDDSRGWALFGQCLRGLRFADVDATLHADLIGAFTQPGAERTHLVTAAASVVFLGTAMIRLRAAFGMEDPAAGVAALLHTGALEGIAADRLLQTLLEATVAADAGLERALTLLRRLLLESLEGNGGQPGTAPLPDRAPWDRFTVSLARQCFLNEYVYDESPAETAAVERLDRDLLARLEAGQSPPPGRVALLAAYRPLHRWAGAGALLSRSQEPAPAMAPAMALAMLGPLLQSQIVEPREEDALRPLIPRLTPIEDAVSRAVRDQYEESPHPRWVRAGLLDTPLPVPRIIHSMFPHVSLDPADWTAPEVLVAGCGTGREPVWSANQFRGARILAVDLSLSSLAYARRQSERLGLAAIEYAQADLFHLGTLGRRFDLIQSVGVLHHMADPFAAWQGLTNLLRPHGLMQIGLYSETGRQAVVAGRALIAERGHPATPAGIRRFRQEVYALPDGHPVREAIRSLDFHSMSACRDLLFHVHEVRVTLTQLAGWLDRLGLEFLGFQLDDPAEAQLYRQRFPEDRTMTRLDLWERFEAERPAVFGGLYQFWVRRRA